MFDEGQEENGGKKSRSRFDRELNSAVPGRKEGRKEGREGGREGEITIAKTTSQKNE